MRPHHSFYGLALMAMPSRTAKMIGSMIILDSLSYMLQPLRGGVDASGKFKQYDFINVIVDNFALFFNGFIGAGIAENINENWGKDTQAKKVDDTFTKSDTNHIQSLGMTYAECNYTGKKLAG